MSRSTKLGIYVSTIMLIIMTVFVAVGFYLSNLLREGAFQLNWEELPFTLMVESIEGDQLTLRATDKTDKDGDWRRPGIYGLESELGYTRVLDIVHLGDQWTVREFTHFSGEELKEGQMVKVDGFAYPENPLKAHGIKFSKVTYNSPVGSMDSWVVGGAKSTWAIFVHGKSADAREALRLIPTLVDEGFPIMVIEYRNDEGVPPDPSNSYQYGLSEWQDLEGAVRYALDHGADDVVLVGYSMGGAIVINFLYQSTLAGKVTSIILDSPVLDFEETVDLGIRENGYPGILGWMAKVFSGLRFGVEWDKLNYLSRVDELDIPILLFHGDADQTVPVETSDKLARSRPDIVTYLRLSETRHVRAWNTNRKKYEQAVREFLKE